MDIATFSRNIEGLPGAELLVQVARYADSTDDFMSPDFELFDDGLSAALCWFDSDSDAASRFTPFAQSRDGGLFAFWNCESACPVVYLASECEGTRVIAQNVPELLSLVAYGSDDYVIDVQYTDQDEEWNGPEEVSASLEAFRQWLKSALAIAPAISPLAIIKSAMLASPDLMAWIRNWQDRKYGTQAS